MARTRIAPGTVGPVALTEDLTADQSKRWRGLTRAVDIDCTQHMVRRWRPTKAAAEAAARRAGMDKLAELMRKREAEAKNEAVSLLGDLTTTVGDLLDATMSSAEVQALAPGTIANYSSVTKMIQANPVASLRPRELDVAEVRAFLTEHTEAHGRSSGQTAKAILTKAMDRAVESRAMQVGFNPVSAAKRAVPNVTVRPGTIDHKRTPDNATVTAMLAALRNDAGYGPMLGARLKSAHGAAGTADANPTDVADLVAFTFATGCRVGEASALRWSDLHLTGNQPHAEITGTVRFVSRAAAESAGLPAHGTIRQERTKTAKSDRDVPLSAALAQQLRQRATEFGIDGDNAEHMARPVFPSPQHHNRFREQTNLGKAVKAALAAHGIDYAATHVARKWRITSLVDAGVPVSKVADLVGHTKIETTTGYLGRGRHMDADVRSAL